MSIPERLWRVVKGNWSLAAERIAETSARADAYQELADALRQSPTPTLAPTPSGSAVLPPAPPRLPGQYDPLEAAYELLKVHPGADLQSVELAYRSRMGETKPELFQPGTPERALEDGKRAAIQAAYDKLRDALNPTETRFERLEF